MLLAKSLLAITFALTTTFSTSFAAKTPADSIKGGLSGDIRTSFVREFRNAEIISSEAHKNFTRVTFKMNNNVMFAFYNSNGDLMALSRNILSSQLPLSLQMSLRKEYSKYWIVELIELSGDGQNNYYVSLENADVKITLRSVADESWELYQTDKK